METLSSSGNRLNVCINILNIHNSTAVESIIFSKKNIQNPKSNTPRHEREMRRRRYTRAPPCTCACMEYKRIHFHCFRMKRKKRNCYHWHEMLLQSKNYLFNLSKWTKQTAHNNHNNIGNLSFFKWKETLNGRNFSNAPICRFPFTDFGSISVVYTLAACIDQLSTLQ